MAYVRSCSVFQMIVYLDHLIPYHIRHKGSYFLRFHVQPPDDILQFTVSSSKIQIRPVGMDEFVSNVLRKGNKVGKNSKRGFYQTNTFGLHYPGQKVYLGEAFSFELSLPTVLFTRKYKKDFQLKVELFIVLKDCELLVTGGSIQIDIISQNQSVNHQCIIASEPFFLMNTVIRSSFLRHKVDFCKSEKGQAEYYTRYTLDLFFDRLLDICQRTEVDLRERFLPEMASTEEVSQIVGRIAKPDDYFLGVTEIPIEERHALLLQFLEKCDENISFLWMHYVSAFTQRIGTISRSLNMTIQELEFWDYCICAVDSSSNENKNVLLTRGDLSEMAHVHRKNLETEFGSRSITHCSQFHLEGTEVPVFIKETIYHWRDAVDVSKRRNQRNGLIVLVHGLEANSSEMALLKNYILCTGIESYILVCSSLENRTHDSIGTQALVIVKEILAFIDKRGDIDSISFIGHSLGSLVIRAAIETPEFAAWVEKLDTFVSLSSPHLGVYCGNGTLMSSGIWLWKNTRAYRSISFAQMTMSDSNTSVADSFLSKLAHQDNLSKFQNVILLGSEQDKYSPIESSLIRPVQDTYPYIQEMKQAIWTNLEKGGVHVVCLSVSFGPSVASGFSHLIGKAAHVNLLTSHSFLRLLTLTIKPYLL